MRIELNCAECGKNSFDLAGGTEDDSPIRCDSCGHAIATMGQVKQRVADEVLRLAAKRDSAQSI